MVEVQAALPFMRNGEARRSNPRRLSVQKVKRGRSSAGRAPALHAGGQEFDPPRLHQIRFNHGSRELPSDDEVRVRYGMWVLASAEHRFDGQPCSLKIQRYVAALLFNAITTRVACRTQRQAIFVVTNGKASASLQGEVAALLSARQVLRFRARWLLCFRQGKCFASGRGGCFAIRQGKDASWCDFAAFLQCRVARQRDAI